MRANERFKEVQRRRTWLICTFLVLAASAFSQETTFATDSVLPAFSEDIDDHKKQLNIKFELSNDINEFSAENGDVILRLKPNLNLRYAFVFSYKFLITLLFFLTESR